MWWWNGFTDLSENVIFIQMFCMLLGGLGVIMCPCGVVYSIKFNLRAESPCDFADLLLSWKHFSQFMIKLED